MRTLKNIGITLFGTLTLISCGGDDSPTEQPQNQAPNVSLTNVTSNDDTNSVSGTLVATDSDGTITQKTLQAEATDGTLVTISLSGNGTFNHTFTNSGKVFDTLLASAKDNDNATDETFANLNPTITVETPNNQPTGTLTLNNFDENTPIGTVIGSYVTNDADGDTLTNTITAGDDKFELDGTDVKTKIEFNHEDLDNTHTFGVETTDGTDTISATETVTENDLQEQQTIDIYGDGGLLPNGEAYAIKTDEEEAGETLPVLHYNHGSNRRLESAIQAELDAADGYGDAPSDISDLYGTGIGPEHNTGQDMVGFDSATNEMIIYAADGAELSRISRTKYAQMMRTIMDSQNTNDSIQLIQDGTVLNTIWEDMIVLHTQNSSQLSIGCDKAIQNDLAQ